MDHDVITPAEIGEWLSFDQCDRFFKHSIDGVEHSENHSGDEYKEAFTALNLLLSESGDRFEENIKQTIEPKVDSLVDLEGDEDEFSPDHDTVLNEILSVKSDDSDKEIVVVFQPTLSGKIGAWDVGGHADFVFLWATDTGVEIRVIDAKATSEEKSYHQIQAATYSKLIEDLVGETHKIDGENIEFSAGVITRESTYQPPKRNVVPSFDYSSRVSDVTRLLQHGNEVDQSKANDLETSNHQIDSKCSQCPYNESCTTEAFEQWSVRILGLTEAEQQVLEDHGISTISGLSDLCVAPKEEDNEWNPMEPKRARLEKPTYSKLKSKPGVGEKLPGLVYRAQAVEMMLENPDSSQLAKWIPGRGACQIPEDDPYNEQYVDYEPNSMVRVYLNIQNDPLRDRLIHLSARVSCGKDEVESIRLSKLSDSAPADVSKANEVEKDLLNAFISDLNAAIEKVSNQIEFEYGNGQEHPLLHFYTYTQNEYAELRDGLSRHSTKLVDAFIDTIEGRAGVDTPRVSHLKDVLKDKIVTTTPSYGLLHVHDELYPPTDEYRKTQLKEEWSYNPPNTDGGPVDIRNIFRQRLFDTDVGWNRTDSGIVVSPDDYPNKGESGLKTRYRYGAEIPLGYLWAAIGRIDDDWMEEISIDVEDNPRISRDINSYRFYDPDEQEKKINSEVVCELGKHFADMVEHVERSLIYRSDRITENKKQFNPENLWKDTHTTPTIAEGSAEYLSIEHTTQQKETYQLYQKLPRQRILSGESLPVKVKSVDEDGGDGLSVVVEGELPYDHPNLFDEDADQVRLVCKRKGKENTSSGDWMVANSYTPSQTSQDLSKPHNIEKGVQAKIRSLNLKEDKVVFELRNMYWEPGEFDCHHRNYTLNEEEATEDDWKTYIGRNEWLILDPATVSFPADRAKKALDNADTNSLHTLLENLRWGKEDALQDTIFDANKMKEFSKWVSDNIPPETFPNEMQREFISTEKQISLLQGPPGTGKTAGTLAPTLCARLYSASESNQSVSGLVTAPSNTAIDELFDDTADFIETLSDHDLDSLSDSTIELVRITGEEINDSRDFVSHLHYNNDKDKAKLKDIHNSILDASGGSLPSPDSNSESDQQATIGSFGDSESNTTKNTDQTHTIVFATPTSSWGLLKYFAGSDAEPEEIASQSLWDFVVSDEASMLTLPKLLLSGVGMQRNAQVLLGGDHRQLPPVQKHEWSDEKRRSVVESAPHLSSLDFVRLLRGDTDMLDNDMLDAVEMNIKSQTNHIPLIQLNTTFRFGKATAGFIGDVMYSKDNIDYTAIEKQNPPTLHTSDSKPIESAYADSDITLIAYDSNREFQQVNIIEATITNILLQNHSSSATAGVTTPHNSQRSRLREILSVLERKNSDSPINLDNGTQVETVNRFQGGERDIMIVSATVSDPRFIRSESDFLLDATRANVALSRHKHKLVIVASKSLLSHIPEDTDTYDNSLLWKSLSKSVGEAPICNEEPHWKGSLEQFTAPMVPPDKQLGEETDVEIYHIQND